jgi:hypothetical protein
MGIFSGRKIRNENFETKIRNENSRRRFRRFETKTFFGMKKRKQVSKRNFQERVQTVEEFLHTVCKNVSEKVENLPVRENFYHVRDKKRALTEHCVR